MSHDHDQTPQQRLVKAWLELGREIHGAIDLMFRTRKAGGEVPFVAAKEVSVMCEDGVQTCYVMVSFDSHVPQVLASLAESDANDGGGT